MISLTTFRPSQLTNIIVSVGVSIWTLYDLISTAYDFYQNFSAIKDTILNFNFEIDCNCMTSEQMEAYRSGITAILTSAIMGSIKPSRMKSSKAVAFFAISDSVLMLLSWAFFIRIKEIKCSIAQNKIF